MGKTALAHEIASYYFYKCKELPTEERFQAIIWFSAKETVLTGDQILSRWPTQKTIEDLYATIAEVFSIAEIGDSTSLEEKDIKVRQVLKNQRTLVILDNLETVDDERLLDFILRPPIPTKIIVTTRHWVSVAYPLKLEGMPHEDALHLIDQQCQIGSINLDDDAKDKLITRTGGLPLAIVWSIGLTRSGMPIETVLNLLGSAKSSVAKFIFQKSVEQINNTPAINLLATLALFLEYASDYKVRQHAYREELGTLSQLPDADRDEGLAALFQLSLINPSSNRFSLLPLTKSFVLEEIVENSEKPYYEDLRKRVNNAVFNLSQHTPFIYGTPVPPERFVGRQREIRTILNRIRTGQSTFISGEPRSGKSSLLRYISSDVVGEILEHDSTRSIKIELNASEISTPNEFWLHLFKVIGQTVVDPKLKKQIDDLVAQPKATSFASRRIFQELEKQNWRVIVFLDEIEHLLNNPHFIDNAEFWGSTRSLASTAGSFQLLITSAYSISYINNLTLNINPYGSPYFNIYVELLLRPISKETTEALLTDALEATQVRFTENDKNLLIWLSGRHPYRVQVAGAALFDVMSNNGSISNEDKYLTAIQQFYERTINHFDDLWSRYFSDEAKLVLIYLGLIEINRILEEQVPQKASLEIARLGFTFRELDNTGWIQMNEKIWQISVGGFLFWLIDMIYLRDDKMSLKTWLVNLELATESLPLEEFFTLYDQINDLKLQQPIETLAKNAGKKFIGSSEFHGPIGISGGSGPVTTATSGINHIDS